MKQVVKQIKERIKFEFELEAIKYELWRLDDYEYRKLQKNSFFIKDEDSFYNNISLPKNQSQGNLNLAQSFITLTWLFGNSSDSFDSSKGSFSFPVRIQVAEY